MVNEVEDDRERMRKQEAVQNYQDGQDIVMPLVPLTVSDCIEYIPRKYIIDGLIEDETITLFAGKEKIGKTYVLMHMALCMSAEKPWLEMQTMSDAKGNILWLDFDMNRNTTLRRMNEITNGIEESWNVRNPHLFDNFQMMDAQVFREAGYTDKVQFFDESDAVEGLKNHIITNNVKACFIDNLVQIEGSAQENSSNDIQRVFSRLKQLRDETHCAFIIIHHTTKDGYRGRGSSDIFGETDLNLQLDQAEDKTKLILKTDGARNQASQDIGLWKQFEWRIGEDGFSPEMDSNGHYIYNFKLTRIDTDGLTQAGKDKEKKDSLIRDNIEKIILLFQKNGNTGLTKNGIVKACNTDPRFMDECKLQGGRDLNLKSINAAAERGDIIFEGGFYKLPS